MSERVLPLLAGERPERMLCKASRYFTAGSPLLLICTGPLFATFCSQAIVKRVSEREERSRVKAKGMHRLESSVCVCVCVCMREGNSATRYANVSRTGESGKNRGNKKSCKRHHQ